MPNWCYNEISMYGEPEDIKAIKELITSKESPFDFNKIIPMPKEMENTESLFKGTEEESQALIDKYGANNWYDWRLNNWGTKWNITEADVEAGDEDIYATFDTAWSPPEGIHNYLQEKFPDVQISWFFREDGMQAAGWL